MAQFEFKPTSGDPFGYTRAPSLLDKLRGVGSQKFGQGYAAQDISMIDAMKKEQRFLDTLTPQEWEEFQFGGTIGGNPVTPDIINARLGDAAYQTGTAGFMGKYITGTYDPKTGVRTNAIVPSLLGIAGAGFDIWSGLKSMDLAEKSYKTDVAFKKGDFAQSTNVLAKNIGDLASREAGLMGASAADAKAAGQMAVAESGVRDVNERVQRVG